MRTPYGFLLDPTIYPDYTRRTVKVPTWKTFDNTTQFTTLRCFTQKDGRLVDWEKDLDLYVNELKLGRVIWPVFPTLYAENFKDLVAEIKRRGLFLFDFWGHVPGSGTEGMWSHCVPPPGMVAYLEKELGDHFLGIDNGEQDGRYVGGYAPQQCPSFSDRFRQYLNFQRHFQRMGNDLGNHLSALVSLCFGHYFLKEGNHVLLGAETAQALPNSQIYYAFIRGAGKQYGVHWFGNASIFNRWGYKSYESEGSDGYHFGPEHGTSLNLLKRLLYSHYLYNCVTIGFEQSWIQGDNTEKRLKNQPVPMQTDRKTCLLSPVGVIQAKAVEFVEKHGQPGVMQTPVALLLDSFAGWAHPRHLYTGNVYQVWGGIPYAEGDYLTHGVLSLLYPGYEDASYYRDERGFLSPTPYGDMTDCLLSDAPLWVLQQYGLVILAGGLQMTLELRDKLRSHVEAGGQVVMTGTNAASLVPGLELDAKPVKVPAHRIVKWSDDKKTDEQHAFELYAAKLPPNAEIQATCDGKPLVISIAHGKGGYTVLLSPFGLNGEPLVRGPIKNAEQTPLVCPHVLLEHVKQAIGGALERQQLFSISEGLSLITCRKAAGVYTLGVHNNSLKALPLKIVSQCGKIISLTELTLDQAEKGREGYWPLGFAENDSGTSDQNTIAGGDIRIFEVKVYEEDVTCLTRISPPARPRGRMLTLLSRNDIQEEILKRPTFFQHFDGVKVDWTYIQSRDTAQLKREREWLNRQQVRIVVDFSHGLNFYPDLTLLDTFLPRYEKSVAAIDDVLAKMAHLGSRDAVFCLHRKPENHCDEKRADDRFLSGVRDLCGRAGKDGIMLHLQHHPHKWHGSAKKTVEFIGKVNAGNLRFALNTGHAAMTGEDVTEVLASAGEQLGMILVCAPRRDIFGQPVDAHCPVSAAETKASQPAVIGNLSLPKLRAYRHIPQILDADYANHDEEYLDCRAVWNCDNKQE
ncbi:MAG: sugar phosphate isomerase/epimerase [Verrucomicrobia bacterium]|nr:sugar phosphate isomerase/epimerase [Verrucomicrobiota bacterium]MCG2681255.1 sugar phosphate isomerase/epimerase [Kiritimatiellia bacterium]MBU4246923.1 sugar phosphate isomerase/epimerase [Verrucomicrobiota bacterium]MBU4291591.1 sugar phosphate isomerase/epimerase [Verrucomicrobiota bacterium]MBU4428310.1 sugar phosphate isomerase/epimerase [Verrucomicrobiota bacterium]